jgi:hypothetical protein
VRIRIVSDLWQSARTTGKKNKFAAIIGPSVEGHKTNFFVPMSSKPSTYSVRVQSSKAVLEGEWCGLTAFFFYC